MRRKHWEIKFGILLILLSAGIYGLHYTFFRDSRDIFSNFLLFSAYVPIDVLLVTLIIHKMLAMHARQEILQKLNMVIGVFYTEMGVGLLKRFQEFDLDRSMLSRDLIIDNDWTPEKFSELLIKYSTHNFSVDCKLGDLAGMKGFLVEKRGFLLGLLANPNLLEHDGFTDVLWAVFHLTEELCCRADLSDITEADCAHLSGDVKRAYSRLIVDWLAYMMHLKKDYPYLFSLAVRTNPFDTDARVEYQ